MNKYLITGLIVIAGIGAGVALTTKKVPAVSKPVSTGHVVEHTVRALKGGWAWGPETLEVTEGDTVNLTVINEDTLEHGFAIDEFQVSKRIAAGETTQISFVASKSGEFPFFCNVPCQSGEVDGKIRGHFDMVGKLIVKNTPKA